MLSNGDDLTKVPEAPIVASDPPIALPDPPIVVPDHSAAPTPADSTRRADFTESESIATEVSRVEAGVVFISYKVTPDEPKAAALRDLMLACIEPPPRIFVSGLGGILPSDESAKGQIQKAAQEASAFIAIITKDSINREWIFFEAGAAWGRNVLYAPLMAGVKPEELPNTINSYQGVDYSKEESVRDLLRVIASRLHAKFKVKAFAKRHAAFAETMDEELGKKAPSDSADQPHTWRYGVELIVEGSEAANAILDNFAPGDSELRHKVELFRIAYDPKLSNLQRLMKVEGNKELLASGPATGYRAQWEPSPHKALELAMTEMTTLRQNTPPEDSYPFLFALEIAASKLKLLGRDKERVKLLQDSLKDSRRIVRANAALKLAESQTDVIGKATLAAFAVSCHPTNETLDSAARILHASGPVALAALVASMSEGTERTGEQALWLGLAYSNAELRSLAYGQYKIAADKGVSVASINMASLLGNGAVPSAGLAIFEANPGPYHAYSPGYPYSLRSELEQAVQTEREKAAALLKAGRSWLAVMTYAVETSIQAGRALSATAGKYRSSKGTTYEVQQGSNAWIFTAEGGTGPFIIINSGDPLPGLAVITGAESGLVSPLEKDHHFRIQWLKGTDPPVNEDFEPYETTESAGLALGSGSAASS